MIVDMSPESQHWPDAQIAMAQDTDAGAMDDDSADDADMRAVAGGERRMIRYSPSGVKRRCHCRQLHPDNHYQLGFLIEGTEKF